jgi:hypothetical protein
MKRINAGKYLVSIAVSKKIPDVVGFGSITQDELHIPVFDLDNKKLAQVKKEIRELQETYNLSNAYIFQSSENNYHAIILDKLSFGMVIDLHRAIKNYDSRHDVKAVKRGYWVLRLSKKGNKTIRYVTRLKRKPARSSWSRSNAHRVLLEKIYNIKIKKSNGFDNHIHLIMDKYNTVKKLI